MMSIEEMYGPTFRSLLSQFSDESRVLLEPAVPNLIDAIEEACPASMIVLRKGGIATPYGPMGFEDCEFLLSVGTPTKSIFAGMLYWPKPLIVEDVPPQSAEMWGGICSAIEYDRKDLVAPLLAAKLGEEGISKCNSEFKTIRNKGLTPTVVSIVAASGRHGCGACIVIPLPPSIEQQIREIEEADNL